MRESGAPQGLFPPVIKYSLPEVRLLYVVYYKMDKDELMLLLHYFGLDENNIAVAFHNPADVSILILLQYSALDCGSF